MEFKRYRRRGALANEIEDEHNLLDGKPLSTLFDTPPVQDKFRDSKYIHISDLINTCKRAIAIHYVHDKPYSKMRINHQLSFTFEQGHAIANHVENHVRINAPEHMYGGWVCKCGKTERLNNTYDKVDKIKCKICGSGLDTYKELYLVDEEYQISGSVDLTLLFYPIFYVSEIKSIKKDKDDGFVALTQAKPLHRLQALFYNWLIARQGRRVHPMFSVFYVNKSYGWKLQGDQIKEFQMKYSDYAHTLEPYLQDAKEIKLAREGGPLPKRPYSDFYCNECKGCSLAPMCWNLPD